MDAVSEFSRCASGFFCLDCCPVFFCFLKMVWVAVVVFSIIFFVLAVLVATVVIAVSVVVLLGSHSSSLPRFHTRSTTRFSAINYYIESLTIRKNN